MKACNKMTKNLKLIEKIRIQEFKIILYKCVIDNTVMVS